MTDALAAAESPSELPRGMDALLEAQARVLDQVAQGRSLREILEALCRIVEAQADRPVVAAILLLERDGNGFSTGAAPSLLDAYNRTFDAVAAGIGLHSTPVARREVVTCDIATDPCWAALRHLPLGLGLQAVSSTPIVSSAGATLGAFCRYVRTAGEAPARERRLVEVLAQIAALAIERRRAEDVLQSATGRDQFLSEVAAATQPLVEPSEVMATTARMLAEHLDADRCAYAEVEEEEVFAITGDHTRGVPSIVGRWPVAAFGRACVRCMRAGEPYIVTDAEVHPEIGPEDLPAYRATSIRAVVCVPLHKDGKFVAAMAVHQTRARRWTPAEVSLIEVVVGRCWEALERARVSRTLRESEARYRVIVDASPECVMLVGSDGALLQMNAAGLRMIEASPSQGKTGRGAVGTCVYDIVAVEHREAFRAFNERVCRGESGTIAFDLVGLGGTRRSTETTAVPLPAAAGGFIQLAVVRDVTAKVAADRALDESRARLDYAVRLSGIGFWYCDLPFDELIWDARVKEHFFFAPDARVTIDAFYDRIHPDDRVGTRAAIDASIRERAPYDIIYRTVEPGCGAIKWIRALGGTTYAEDGTPSRFDGVTVDVTAQKLGEKRLAGLLHREREYGRLLKQVAAAALSIHASDSLGSVLRVCTEEARRIIQAEEAMTILPAGNDWERAVHVASHAELPSGSRTYDGKLTGEGPYAVVCRTNQPMRLRQDELETHPALRRSGGAALPPHLRGCLAVPLVARNGSNLGVVQLSNKLEGDFSEADEAVLVQLAQIAAVAIENARLYDELREQDRHKDEFLATLAHELRNPLAPVRTGLRILQITTDAGQASKTRAMMERQLTHLVRMVDDLLDVSRVTLGKLTLKREPVDFRAVLQSALETTGSLIEAGGHQFDVRLPEEPLPMEVDPTRIAQVLANLISNAVKYTPAAGRVSLDAARDGGTLVVRLSDTGVGIPKEMLSKVFDMFTQVDRSSERAQVGLGIGLTLVRRLVQMHGGQVTAESPGPGCGSVFTVRLPLAAAAVGDGAAPIGSSVGTTRALRVLVVDDNVDAAESLALLLEFGGHEIRMAHSGPDALTAASVFQPDVIFLDIGLPGFSGYEVARQLRANLTQRQPLLIALTGWGSEEDRRRAHAAGFDRHLVKPFDLAKLDEVLATARP